MPLDPTMSFFFFHALLATAATFLSRVNGSPQGGGNDGSGSIQHPMPSTEKFLWTAEGFGWRPERKQAGEGVLLYFVSEEKKTQ